MPAGEDLERRPIGSLSGQPTIPAAFRSDQGIPQGAVQLRSLPVRWVLGFFLCGSLFGMTGALMVAWRYYMGQDSRLIGLHFFALDGGMLLAHLVARRYVNGVSVRWVMITGSLIGAVGLVALSLVLPPAPMGFRLIGLVVVGAGVGVIFSGLFYLIRPFQQSSSAAVVNFNGALFGFGAFFVTMLIGGTYYLYTVQFEMLLLATMPLVFLAVWWRQRKPASVFAEPAEKPEARIRYLGSIAAALFSLLLFFQFGNEWSIATWLPLFLVRRLGSDPESAVFVLALYFFALIAGRAGAQLLLRRVDHAKLLMISTVTAIVGYFGLSMTSSLIGASAAVVLIGAGFASIYPLVAEKVGRRFGAHPGFYDSIFLAAVGGAIFQPALLGFVDYYLGLGYVMLLPAFGTLVVFLLLLLIMLEAKLMGEPASPSSQARAV
jgi:FHS family glucose/mannose:H+ symporter-like MFS transporter